MKKQTKKQIIVALAAATGGLSAIAVAANMAVYDKMFPRYDRPNYELTPGLINYQYVKNILPREELFFDSDDVKLSGYYYAKQRSKGLVVMAHGAKSGGDDYIPFIKFFYEHGYSVFSFNYKGTYESEGDSTIGMCESLVDLDHALDFVNSNARFKGMKIFLFGHSWGGYAVSSVLSIKNNIKACATIAPINDGYTYVLEKGEQYAGKLSSTSKPFITVYQRYLFRQYVEYNGVKGINESNIPVLVAHGVDDNVVLYDKQSIIAKKDIITNKKVKYYVGLGVNGGHDNILYSEKSYLYRQKLSSLIHLKELELKRKLNESELKEFYKDVDHFLYSEVNQDLMNEIIKMFNKEL